MAGQVKASRPLPAEPVEEDTYQDPGFEEDEFSDAEDGVDYVNETVEPVEEDTYEDPGFNKDKFSEDEEEEAYENNGVDEITEDDDEEVVVDSAPLTYDEVPRAAIEETYEEVPQLPPKETYEDEPQDEYLEPGKTGEGMGPTKTISEIPRRKSGKQKPRAPAPAPGGKLGNRPAPPLPGLQTKSSAPSVNRTLPPVPATDSTPQKRSLSSRPLPNVPHSNAKKLSGYPWYFGDIDRHEAVDKIEILRQDGAYLIRNSARDPNNPYTLSLFYKNKVWHLHIRIRPDGKCAIGALKPDEECFAGVPELIEYHKDNSITLMGQNGGETQLVIHPQK
ncbi:hypothetical protein LSAT2_008068 [Lamellibrachia satsuma]|nr:hypothetical protein LSAT2_008068 [Lamellibrachia satsuma]